jgi:hypothetical protein
VQIVWQTVGTFGRPLVFFKLALPLRIVYRASLSIPGLGPVSCPLLRSRCPCGPAASTVRARQPHQVQDGGIGVSGRRVLRKRVMYCPTPGRHAGPSSRLSSLRGAEPPLSRDTGSSSGLHLQCAIRPPSLSVWPLGMLSMQSTLLPRVQLPLPRIQVSSVQLGCPRHSVP